MTFQEYLADAFHRQAVIDHQLRIYENIDGDIVFYIHPANRDGRTATFAVKGNTLTGVSVAYEAERK